jgi:hypothetical protein
VVVAIHRILHIPIVKATPGITGVQAAAAVTALSIVPVAAAAAAVTLNIQAELRKLVQAVELK